MFISEVSEARYYGLNEVTQADVNESNDAFAKILGREMIRNPHEEFMLWGRVKIQYTELAKWNLVAEYNSGRWFYEDGHMDIRSSQTVDGNLLPNYLNH
jgi:hypothetical protein